MRSFSVLLLLACLAACHPYQMPHDGRFESQNTSVYYYDSGRGDTTLLFVHGWCGNRGYWYNQINQFKDRYRIVTIDLPGSGQSAKTRTDWSVPAYAKDINALIDELQLNNVVLIGHSMSGAIVLETALQRPGAAIAIVGIDNFKSLEPSSPQQKEQMDSFYTEARQYYTPTMIRFASHYLFSSNTDTIVRERVMNDIKGADSSIAISILQQHDAYPLAEKLAAYKKRLYLINSDVFPNDTASLIKRNIPYALYTIHGSGHYPMMEQPDSFNRALQAILHRLPEH
jgi:pimeloyl-ACP methyl ester carboxylesterase